MEEFCVLKHFCADAQSPDWVRRFRSDLTFNTLQSRHIQHLRFKGMAAEVLKQGTKKFWKTKTSIEVLLVEHKELDILEIVCFDPITSQEAPRIYLLYSKLLPLISEEEIQYRLFELQEPILQRRGVIDNEALLKIVWNDAVYDYIDERLELHKKLAGSKAFHVNLRKPLPEEGPQTINDLMCSAPPSLVPHELDHFTAPR